MTIEELLTYLFTPVAQVAIIMGLAEIIKKIGFNKKFIPLVDIGLGLISGIGVFFFGLNYGLIESILIGLALGLSACGLFSGIKNVFQKNKEEIGESDEN